MKEKDKAKRRKRKLEGHQAGTHICTLYLDTCTAKSGFNLVPPTPQGNGLYSFPPSQLKIPDKTSS